jgi:hypothetical protein
VAERFLFVFGYETPGQLRANDAAGTDDEDSAAVFIEADGPEAAEQWGHQIAEAFFAWLHRDPNASWRALQYANWIERDPSAAYDPESLVAIPTVSCGQYPDWDAVLGRNRKD